MTTTALYKVRCAHCRKPLIWNSLMVNGALYCNEACYAASVGAVQLPPDFKTTIEKGADDE
jgi:hypothetical protein